MVKIYFNLEFKNLTIFVFDDFFLFPAQTIRPAAAESFHPVDVLVFVYIHISILFADCQH